MISTSGFGAFCCRTIGYFDHIQDSEFRGLEACSRSNEDWSLCNGSHGVLVGIKSKRMQDEEVDWEMKIKDNLRPLKNAPPEKHEG